MQNASWVPSVSDSEAAKSREDGQGTHRHWLPGGLESSFEVLLSLPRGKEVSFLRSNSRKSTYFLGKFSVSISQCNRISWHTHGAHAHLHSDAVPVCLLLVGSQGVLWDINVRLMSHQRQPWKSKSHLCEHQFDSPQASIHRSCWRKLKIAMPFSQCNLSPAVYLWIVCAGRAVFWLFYFRLEWW